MQTYFDAKTCHVSSRGVKRQKEAVLPQTESVVCGGSWGAVREEVGCAAGKL